MLEVGDATGRLGLAGARWLRDRAAAAAAHLGAWGEVEVRVVNDAAMAALHERFAGVPGTTDVLTFDHAASADGGGRGGGAGALDVDVYVCLDEAARQAAERGLAVERELLLYVVHGMLHCLGEDDHEPGRAVAMHRREDEVLAAIGVGVTYGRAPGGGA